MSRILVVGGGIIGTMHAFWGIQQGHEVIQIERDCIAQSASVRNFGLIWVSGRASGEELSLALRSRSLWEEIGTTTDIGFRANGSITIAQDDAQMSLVHRAAELPDADFRGFKVLSRSDIKNLEPLIKGKLEGGLLCEQDAVVEPALLLPGLRKYLTRTERYSYHVGEEINDFRESDGSVYLRSSSGTEFAGDYAVICPGSYKSNFIDSLTDQAPLRQVRIQMASTQSLPIKLHHSLADIDSFRYYPAFKGLDFSFLTEQNLIAKRFKMQLLVAPRLDGTLTIGDTHEYEEPFTFYVEESPYRYLHSLAEEIFGLSLHLERRWAGIYSQTTSEDIYYRKNISSNLFVVTGGGGRGNTLAPAIAEETFKLWGL